MKYALSATLAASLVLAGAPAPLLAQQNEEISAEERARKVEELATEGAKAYRTGDFSKAIEHFQKAYALEPVPNLLYNIAKSYEKQEKYEEAVEYYQKFVVAPEVDSKARQTAMDRIDSLREIADLKQGAVEPGKPGPQPAPQPSEPTEPTEEGGTNSLALWTTVGGAALLAGAGTFGYLALQEADAVDNAATYEERQSAQSSGETYALVADGLLVGGVVVTGLGLYLFLTDGESEPEASASRTVVTPWVSGDGAGVGMSLDF